MKFEKITGFRIKKIRTEKKMSQTELAKALNVSQTTITAWENAKQQPSIEKLNLLAQILEVDTNYLTGLDTETQQKIIELMDNENIYTKNNNLSKDEIQKITKYFNTLNELNEKYKFETNNNINRDILVEIIITKTKIIECILDNKQIREYLFEISYKKPLFSINEATTIPSPVTCSYAQKNIINDILGLNNEQCIQLKPLISQIKNKNDNETYTLVSNKKQPLIKKLNILSDQNCKRVNDFIDGILIAEDEKQQIIEKYKKET